MLNALRHQRFGTRAEVRSWPTSARVLNALRHQRFGTVSQGVKVHRNLGGAQRLTASEVWHLSAASIITLSGTCSTPYGIRGLAPTEVQYLDSIAVSAQRLTASEVWHAFLAEALLKPLYVLNALRHQRFGTGQLPHQENQPGGAQRLTASEVWHLGRARTAARSLGAQRLTASEVWHRHL